MQFYILFEFRQHFFLSFNGFIFTNYKTVIFYLDLSGWLNWSV